MVNLNDSGTAISTSIILLGVALALPNISLGNFGLDFSQFSTISITIIRLGIIALAINIGLKPLDSKGSGVF